MDREQVIHFFTSSGLVGIAAAGIIAEQFVSYNIDKGTFLLKEGKISNEYLFLEQGFMRAYAIDTEGNEVTTSFYSDGQVVFEVSSFFNRVPSKENIEALTDCTGWMITYEQLNKLFHTVPEFREFGRHILVKGYSALKVRMLEMITEKAEDRYAALLAGKPEILQRAPLKYIASYLGITDTSLSRIRKEYSKK